MFQPVKYQQQLLSTYLHPLKLFASQVHYRSSGTNRTGGYEIKQTRFHLLRRKMERTFTKTYLQDFGFYSLESTVFFILMDFSVFLSSQISCFLGVKI